MTRCRNRNRILKTLCLTFVIVFVFADLSEAIGQRTESGDQGLDTVGSKAVVGSESYQLSSGIQLNSIEIWVGLATAIVAVMALLMRTYFGVRSANQSYYAHLSNVWYALKKIEEIHADWLDCEITTLEHIDFRGQPPAKLSAYDAHAWACWALVEDWYETYARGLDSNELGLDPYLVSLRLFKRQIAELLHGELLQFVGPVRSIHELHWAWLRVPGNASRFGKSFRDWVTREFDRDRTECFDNTLGAVEGMGLRAKQAVDAGQFLGHFDGAICDEADVHTIQVGESMHVNVETVLRFLNHSCQPNAVVRGLNLFAHVDIRKGEEIFIDYNATEWEISPPFTVNNSGFSEEVGGYNCLPIERKKEMHYLVHKWIRDKYPLDQ